ncbi:unnamed protein product [Parascedosporium putredinis]|uniref:Protein kinase domain-containing protein n=1 Tax=Parascedosporium putredinis TaxID=1442378 RepID=A0A9P1H1V1_9PEZI|nr:unnamed protein product [Parascedosporium putredinis]CAI7993078.1 unnamed protein product [Parascedosporium putredinis]
MAEPFAPRSMKRRNISTRPVLSPKVIPQDEEIPEPEIGREYQLDLISADLQLIQELGSGDGAAVSKVKNLATGVLIARKVFRSQPNEELRERALRELERLHDCHSDWLVRFYGACFDESSNVVMCMEYMDVGSLDKVSKLCGSIRVDVIGKIAEAILGGLTYLYVNHRILHQDVKPSNIFVNSKGHFKLSDFGIPREFISPVSDAVPGETSPYMAPERILGESATVKSDVWSFGISLLELATGIPPFHLDAEQRDVDDALAGPLDLARRIVHGPAPRLPKSDAFPLILEDLVEKCLCKVSEERPTPQELFVRLLSRASPALFIDSANMKLGWGSFPSSF